MQYRLDYTVRKWHATFARRQVSLLTKAPSKEIEEDFEAVRAGAVAE